jgi:hypothetical protein
VQKIMVKSKSLSVDVLVCVDALCKSSWWSRSLIVDVLVCVDALCKSSW